MSADGSSPASRPPATRHQITGALTRQFDPEQLRINQAGAAAMKLALGLVKSQDLKGLPRAARDEEPAAAVAQVYVGQHAWWSCGFYNLRFEEGWNRGPEHVAPEGASCARITVFDAVQRASCE